MSFDLYVWHENEPVTAAEARAKLERWGNGGEDVFAVHAEVGLFYSALLDRSRRWRASATMTSTGSACGA